MKVSKLNVAKRRRLILVNKTSILSSIPNSFTVLLHANLVVNRCVVNISQVVVLSLCPFRELINPICVHLGDLRLSHTHLHLLKPFFCVWYLIKQNWIKVAHNASYFSKTHTLSTPNHSSNIYLIKFQRF